MYMAQDGNIDALVRDLLKGVPTEEVVNPNVGQFPDAVLDDASVQVNKSGSFSVKLIFSDNGRKRFASFQLAEADSHAMVAKRALDWQRALGLVEASNKRGYIVKGDDQETRQGVAQAIVEAIKLAAIGKTIGYKTEERNEFENHQPLRQVG